MLRPNRTAISGEAMLPTHCFPEANPNPQQHTNDFLIFSKKNGGDGGDGGDGVYVLVADENVWLTQNRRIAENGMAACAEQLAGEKNIENRSNENKSNENRSNENENTCSDYQNSIDIPKLS
jgi:hypothetical protein